MAVARVEAERVGGPLAVDRKAGPGQRGGAERTFVHPRPRIAEARDVAAQHFVICDQMVAERHRLRDLKMREAGHDRLGMLVGAFDQHALKPADGVCRFVAGVPNPQPEVGRDLVVARPRGMKATGGRADQLAEPMLDGHVDVLELDALWHAVSLIFGGDLVEAFEDRGRVRVADDPLLAQHRRMRLRCGDILPP